MQEHNVEYLYRLYKNGINMLQDRGYKVTSNINNIEMFTKVFYGKRLINIYLYDDNFNVCLYISKNEKSFIKKDFDNSIKGINKYNTLQNIIISVSIKIGQKILKYIDPELIDKDLKKYNISFISTNNLLINLPEHDYVPKHILYRNGQATIELMKSMISRLPNELESVYEDRLVSEKKDLPRILHIDPIAIWYGANPGDIFKIERRYNNKLQDMINEIKLSNNILEIVYKQVVFKFEKK